MKPFSFQIDQVDLNLRATFECGQVFRWKNDSQGAWHGADGAEVSFIRQNGSTIDGQSTASLNQIQDFLDLKRGDITDRLKQSSPELADYIQASRGVRMLQVTDPVETFAGFLCSANNHLRRIVPMVEHLGRQGQASHGTHIFPGLMILAEMEEKHLRDNGFGYRAATIPRACREAEARGGRQWLFQLNQATYQEAFNELCSIYGLGAKLTDCVLLYGCRQHQAVPIDTHVWAMARERIPEFRDQETLTAKSYKALGDWFRSRHGELAGYAQQRAFAGKLFASRAPKTRLCQG